MSALPRPSSIATLALAATGALAVLAAQQLPGAGAWVSAALLSAGLFGLGIALGGAFTGAACVITSARWWLPIRRVPAALAALLPLPLALLAAVLLTGRGALYEWTHAEAMQASALLQEKSAWLDEPFFLLRAALIMLAWLAICSVLARRLEAAGAAAGSVERKRLVRTAIAFVLLLAPTLSVASWDWIMSLEPEWFSTMFSVYVFSGFFLSGLAACAVIVCQPGPLRGLVPADPGPGVRHDLGKLLFAFSCFWAYVWFCQYMLIWYANIPEESTYFVSRGEPQWAALFWLVPVLSFVVPFVALMSQRAKRSASSLLQVSLVVLAGRWLDIYVMVAPPTGDAAFPWLAVGCGAALLALMAALIRVRPGLRSDSSVAGSSPQVGMRGSALP